MTSVSAHGGLVHVVMRVRSLTFVGITSLVKNSPKLTSLFLDVSDQAMIDRTEIVQNYSTKLKKKIPNRRLFTAGLYTFGYYDIKSVLLDMDLHPLWPCGYYHCIAY